MKFVVDVNLAPRWVEVIVEAGHEAVHWSGVGALNAADIEIMAWAAEKGFVVFTHDLDFGAILASSGSPGPSVVQLREQLVDPSVIGSIAIAGILEFQRQLEEGAIVSIDMRRARARILPITYSRRSDDP